MKTIKVLLVLGALTLLASSARAQTNYALTITLDTHGKPSKCSIVGSFAPDAKIDELKVSLIDAKGKAAAAGEEITLSLDGDPAVSKKIAAGEKGATLDGGSYATRKLTIASPNGDLSAGGCAPQVLAAAAAPKTTTSPATAANLQATVLNQNALAFLAGQKILSHAVEGGVLGKHYRLYHLPDGTPAYPLPVHISEKDYVEIVVVIPIGTAANVDVTSCDKAPGYRIKGSYKDASAAAGKLEGLEAPQFAMQAYPNLLQCAGTLTYKIETSNGSTTTSLTIDPIYRFEWGVGYGFDFGRPEHDSLGDRAAASGMGTEKFVVQSKDYTGAKPIITLGVDVCGTNPADMNWCDRLLMPSIFLDPTRLSEGFGVGLVFRPIFGVGILAGMSVFQTTELADGLTVKPGDAWTASGDLPTKKVFNKDSLGLMLAATLDTEIFAALVP